MKELAGRRALVTGASQGIGFAVAKVLAEVGVDVFATSRNEAQMQQAAVKIKGNVVAIQSDAGQLSDLDGLVDQFSNSGSLLDIVVSNAGLGDKIAIEEMTPEQFDACMDTNLKGPYFLTQALLKNKCVAAGASFIYVSSVAGQIGFNQLSAYSVAKAGLLQLPKSLAVEYVGSGFHFNAIAPGHIHTPLTEGNQLNSDLLGTIPNGQFGLPQDIAEVVLLLASGNYINGATVVVDGGMTATQMHS